MKNTLKSILTPDPRYWKSDIIITTLMGVVTTALFLMIGGLLIGFIYTAGIGVLVLIPLAAVFYVIGSIFWKITGLKNE